MNDEDLLARRGGDWRSPTVAAARLERLIAAGRSADVLAQAGQTRTVPPPIAFVLGRAAEDEEDFGSARDLFELALRADDAETAARATAHLAYLDYYAGLFEEGHSRALRVGRSPSPVVRVEAALYRSVNAMALNRSDEALEAALTAVNVSQRLRLPWLRIDLRFRVSRQLVHVLVARGGYTEASAEAERAAAIARRTGAGRYLGIAAYLRGYAKAARGERAALQFFRDADRQWGGAHHAFGRWLRYVWAAALRDHGDHLAARALHNTTTVRLTWEEPLFDLAEGRFVMPETVGRPADELPFLGATIGLVSVATGDVDRGRAALVDAVQDFQRGGLEHYRRGASLALAAIALMSGRYDETAALIGAELPALTKGRIRRWPWWHQPIVHRLATFCLSNGIGVAYWRELLASTRPVRALEEALRARDLTERELEAVLLWTRNPHLSRPMLAERLGVSESTTRNLLNRARRKLGVGARRGPEALRARIESLVPIVRES